MAIFNMDDIEKRRQEEAKKKISRDASDVVEEVINNLEDALKKKKAERNKKKPFWLKFFKFLGIIILLIFILDLLFGSIWLLRFFIKSLFHI